MSTTVYPNGCPNGCPSSAPTLTIDEPRRNASSCKLKGVGTVWQYSIVDGACSIGFAAARSGRKTAVRMAAFLEAQVVPAYRRAGIPIRAINTDGGPEFGRRFRRTCQRLGIFHRRLPPRSPDLNAFVERFQGTVLQEH